MNLKNYRPPASGLITRFAPAPTGYLHRGHVLNALYVWGLARLFDGRVILRLEDHDRQRSKPEFAAAIEADLAWLGFTPDEIAPRQSESDSVYRNWLEKLARNQASSVYYCDCTRRNLESRLKSRPERASASENFPPGYFDARPYDAYCRGKRPYQDLERDANVDENIRLELAESLETFQDLRLGDMQQAPWRQCGDLLIRDRKRNWSYQFACVVDDLRQGVNLVIRGEDILFSTGRQIQLSRTLGGRTPPAYLHHNLLKDESGQKLSKRLKSDSVAEFRENGGRPADLLGEVAWLGGLLPEAQTLDKNELGNLFNSFV